MRTFLPPIAAAGLLVSGCAAHRGSSAVFSEVPLSHKSPSLGSAPSMIVTADNLLVGKVAKVNGEGRFAVLTFPIGHLPALGQRLSVYRLGLKVGEVRTTGPQLDDSVVGDITVGDAQAGDEVRAQ